MRKIVIAITILFTLVACNQSKPTRVQENEKGTAVRTETADSINPQTKIENMKEVQAFLKECGAFFLATVDGDQPHVRAFGVSEIINDRLYIMTGKVKDVYKQMAKNGKFEICALKPNGREWIRVTGILVNDESLAVKEEFLNRHESAKSMYKADDGNMAVLYITNGTARFCSFGGQERKINF